jgi:hypothetical protein
VFTGDSDAGTALQFHDHKELAIEYHDVSKNRKPAASNHNFIDNFQHE